jgi:uncharacterized membrane protein
MSGFALLTVSYLWNAGTYLVDRSLMDWSPAAAVVAALAFLVVFWLAYDVICRVFGEREGGDTVVGVLVAILVAIAAWLACHLFPGRAAFLLVGAMIATAMTANVAHWIIPGQRKMVASIRNGEPVDPIHGKRGKQRSVHNTYFTLPVLVAMLSNHYSFLWSHSRNWVVLVLLMFAGAAIRQFFVLRHGWKLGRNRHPLPYAAIGVVALIATAVWLAPGSSGKAQAASTPAQVGYAQVQAVLEKRCYLCHGAQVQMKNVRLDSAQGVKLHAANVYQQAVVSRLMPMNNATGITEEERAVIGQWFQQGAKVD